MVPNFTSLPITKINFTSNNTAFTQISCTGDIGIGYGSVTYGEDQLVFGASQ